MKSILSILFSFALIFQLSAQDDKYTSAMKKGLDKLRSGHTYENYQAAANIFERVASVETEKWQPNYYLSYSNMMMAVVKMSAGEKSFEQYVDKAEEAIEKAMALDEQNSEILAMLGYCYQGKIWSSPMVNGMIYGPKSASTLEKSIKLNPNNPRPYYLLGQNLFYTPEMFGGGMNAAHPHLKKADELFCNDEPENELSPGWGKYPNTQLLKQCDAKLNPAPDTSAVKKS